MAENNYDLEYTGSMVDRILDTGYDLQNQGYIFRGLASHYTGTPTERTWLIAPTGSTGFGLSSPVPPGSIGICMYNGSSWSAEVLNTLTLDTSPTTGSGNGITSGAVKTLAESITNAIGQLEQSVSDRFTSLTLEDTTGSLQAELLSITLKYVFDGETESLTSFSFLAATAEKAGLMSAADKQKLDAFITNIRSLRIQDTTAQEDQDTEITNTLKWTIGGVTEAITAFTLYAATTSKAGLMSAADKTALDTLPSLINAGYLYAGIATPSTVPSSTSAKIFYIAIEGGTYTSFGNLNVTQGINIIYKSDNAWSAAQVVGIDNEPTAGSDNLVKSGGVKTELALGAVYDVSAHNNGATFESLSALLSDTDLNALIPTAVRKGGMSIKFVQSSDNKYVQHRLTADDWSTNAEDWVIAEEGVYIENPEFVYVKTDAEGKILWAIKIDGGIYYGAGCPQQVKDYIEDKISSLSLDEYEDIVTFLSDYLGSDTTLKVMIDSINERIPEIIGSPEFLEVITDSEDKILEGIKQDGTKVIGADLEVGGNTTIDGDTKILGNMEVSGVSYKIIENSEYVKVLTDSEGRVICGIKPDGSTYIAQSNISDNLNTRIDGVVEEFNNTIEDVKEELEEDIDNVSAPIFANDAEYNVWRQVQQLAKLKWTPKKTIQEGAGIRPAGVEVTDGMPYSSVKECLKYVGIDVSFHTFMTAVNDEHSLFYTEKPLGSNSVSAYGITYHGVNSLCYYGTVCSGLVTTALGSNIQWDSWAFQTIKDKFEVLDNQDVYNLKVGDIFSQPGHCGVITKIVRDKNGSIIEWQVDEQSAPIHIGDNHNHMTLTNKTWQTNSVWCRYKELYKNTFYKPNPFALADGENLYNIGDFVFIEDSAARNYYRCKTANRDSSFTASHWDAIPEWSTNTQYVSTYYFSIVSYKDRLYRCVTSHTSSDSFDPSNWVEIKEEANEWAAYPYVYNDDIVTFAGDRAAFRSNDLIYINYKKGDYTQIQLYKDSELYKTYDLPNDDSFQINVSSDCAAAGMYKARLTDGTNYSRYTYFEVIDAQVSATYTNGIAELTFSSSNGRPLVAQIVERSGGTLCHKPLTGRDIADGTIQFNPLARLYAERWSNWGGFRNKTDLAMYARVIFEGVYGNVVNEMIYLATENAITGDVVYPNTPIDLSIISGDRNIILADTMIGNTYIVNFEIGENANVSILSGIGTVTWKTELPSTLTAGDFYQIKIENGLGNVTKIN